MVTQIKLAIKLREGYETKGRRVNYRYHRSFSYLATVKRYHTWSCFIFFPLFILKIYY